MAQKGYPSHTWLCLYLDSRETPILAGEEGARALKDQEKEYLEIKLNEGNNSNSLLVISLSLGDHVTC